MKFIIRLPINKPFRRIQTDQHLNIKKSDCDKDAIINIAIENNNKFIKKIETQTTLFFFIGDIILPRQYNNDSAAFFKYITDSFNENTISKLKGFFYLIHIDKKKRSVAVYNSMFSILPIYYYLDSDFVYISSSTKLLLTNINKKLEFNKSAILQKTLFYYTLFDETYFSDIKTVPSNSFISYDPSFQVKKHTVIEDFFVQNPMPWKSALEPMSDYFIKSSSDYFPDEPYYSTFTGGFDGRTLIALSLASSKSFKSFSYGDKKAKDILVPKSIAEQLNIEYFEVILDKNFAEKHYLVNAIELLEKTEGNANLSRAHYNYIAKLIGKNTNFLLSGNFGSEILRSMKIAGVMTSQELFDIFSVKDDQTLKTKILANPKLKYLNLHNFKNELQELIDVIFDMRRSFKKDLTLNQNFYIYMFEQVFRKYFGPEIILQSEYFFNRSPYLDLGFITELLKTELSGANASFMENNPIIRFRGQVLYSNILKKSWPQLADFPTDRGYKPKDFFTLAGKLNIAKSFTLTFSKMLIDLSSQQSLLSLAYLLYMFMNFLSKKNSSEQSCNL